MPWFPDPNGGPPIQAATNPNPAGGSLGLYSDPSYNGPPPAGASAPASSGGGGGGSSAASGGGGGGGSLAGLSAFSAQASGVTQAQLAEQKREFDAQLQWMQQMWQQQGLPQLEIQQRSQALQEQQYQSQLQLAQQSMALQQAQALGYYQTPQTLGGAFTVGNNGIGSASAGTGLGTMGTSTGATTGGGTGLPSGTVVRTSSNQFGVVQANGSIAQGGDHGPIDAAIFRAIQSNGGIMTIPDAQFAAGVAIPNAPATGTQAASTIGTNATGTTVIGPNGQPLPAGAVPTLAGQQQAFQQQIDAANLTGQYQGNPTLQAQQQAFQQQLDLQNLALSQGQLGLSYLGQAAQLQGPQNVFQQSNFYRGAQGNANMPVFLQALANNNSSQLPAFQATGTAAQPLNMSTLAGGLTGQNPNLGTVLGTGATPGTSGAGTTVGSFNPAMANAAGGSFDQNAMLNTIAGINQAGAQKLAPGTLERLSPDELQAFGSGLGQVGGSLPSFLTQYQNSRPQQSAMTGDMSLAA